MAEGSGLIRRFYEDVIGNGQLDLVDEFVVEDLIDHEEGFPGQPPGREGAKFFANAIREAFPDISAKSVEPTMVDGNLEAARTLVAGTHKGEFMGIAPTDKTVEFESIDIIRVEDGKVAEHWGVTDTMSLMQQLGRCSHGLTSCRQAAGYGGRCRRRKSTGSARATTP
jgi:predicted ester cyclase